MNTTFIIVGVLLLVVGFGVGYWVGGSQPENLDVKKTSDECWQITVKRNSTKSYLVVQDGQTTKISPGESQEVCGDFDLYESYPLPWDPDE